jgi:putative membrane protein
MRTRRHAIFLLALSFACTPDTSQIAPPPPRDRSARRAVELAPQDRDFLERAAQGGNAEVAIGALTQIDGRTRNAAVAAFGRMMVTDHSASNAKLTALAGRRNIVLPTSLGEHQAAFDRIQDKRLEAFDAEFVRIMVDDHHQAILLYRSEASGGVDPHLKAFAAATLPALEAHLTQAQALAASVQGNIPDDSQAPEDEDLTKEEDPRGTAKVEPLRR